MQSHQVRLFFFHCVLILIIDLTDIAGKVFLTSNYYDYDLHL